MERTSNCRTFASLVALVVLVLFPLRCWCTEDINKSRTEAKTKCCVIENAELKRSDDVDFDTFVSLMGRRRAVQPNSHRNAPLSRKRHMDNILADLLGRRTRMVCPCTQEY